MNKLADFTLQAIFVGGIVIIALAIYFTRIVSIQAGDPQTNQHVGPYDNFVSAYQFEQEEKKILTKISVLKVDYASDLMVFKDEVEKIKTSFALSQLEKREKLYVLDAIYSNQYFQRKSDLIGQEQAVLTTLRDAKCQKYCVFQDLPSDV
jgi:hypothetical protein